MYISEGNVGKPLAALLLSIVATQLIYMGLRSAGISFNSNILWTFEAAAFLGITMYGLCGLARGGHAAWAAIAIGGMLNVIQAGMGLAMFGPLKAADEALGPALAAVQGGAFFFYFAGKFAFAFAAIFIGAARFTKPSKGRLHTAICGISILVGIAAFGINLAAMGMGMTLTFWAGASGTLATFFLALIIPIAKKTSAG